VSLNRYAARRDTNEPEVVSALRSIGAQVWTLNRPCDLLCGYRGRFVTVEVKDGRKPPSKRTLTKPEQDFADTCRVFLLPHLVVLDAEDAVTQLMNLG
jgi:hypothetical protein